ncbi:MAG: L-2-amino-thiazoline-4-carboxylic acid hydrolase [Candidatus Bipolaricaulota bacterium]|nr:MAG: L-2-amino-thiazoline-4-carboxylic acid hydrolase [Candidatus Bipolaricaulota bacterium]
MTDPRKSDFTPLGTGYRWEAMVFLMMWEEIENRYGAEAAKEIGTKAMEEAGIRFGERVAEIWGRNDLEALKEVWEALYGAMDTEWDGARFVVHGRGCIIKTTYDMLDIPAERRAALDQMFCVGDQGFVSGFNPEIRFSFGGRMLRGEPECVWIMEAPE